MLVSFVLFFFSLSFLFLRMGAVNLCDLCFFVILEERGAGNGVDSWVFLIYMLGFIFFFPSLKQAGFSRYWESRAAKQQRLAGSCHKQTFSQSLVVV